MQRKLRRESICLLCILSARDLEAQFCIIRGTKLHTGVPCVMRRWRSTPNGCNFFSAEARVWCMMQVVAKLRSMYGMAYQCVELSFAQAFLYCTLVVSLTCTWI